MISLPFITWDHDFCASWQPILWGFTNPINKLFFDIEKQLSDGGMGVQQAVVITKNCSMALNELTC
jgi:hypothetical protein